MTHSKGSTGTSKVYYDTLKRITGSDKVHFIGGIENAVLYKRIYILLKYFLYCQYMHIDMSPLINSPNTNSSYGHQMTSKAAVLERYNSTMSETSNARKLSSLMAT